MAYAPTLTADLDANPAPRVEVQFPTLDPSCQTINIERTQEGRTYQVRGGISKFAVGGAAVLDAEAGFGLPLTYRAEMFDSSGVSLGYTDSATVTLAVTDTWIHQPLSPALAVKARVFVATSNSVQRVTPGQFVIPEGASVGMWIGGQRQGIQGLQFQFRVDPSDADTFQNMFGSYSSDYPGVVCVRTPPPVRLPRTLFLSPSQSGPVETAQANFQYITYVMGGNESRPPSNAIIIPLLRREDLDAAYATRGAKNAVYPSRLAQDTDYSKAGLAG
ncbi:hypothetical protein [Gryllotalpicola koreensis]|uniref:Uncharacterized protein n=1 Tax=Gryllotalpicola koreensis TaxID=993086 RepID=A0ABP8A1N9_9MICO